MLLFQPPGYQQPDIEAWPAQRVIGMQQRAGGGRRRSGDGSAPCARYIAATASFNVQTNAFCAIVDVQRAN